MNDEHEQSEPEEYRPVSMLAVFALVAGCGSALALATQVLWGLPLVAAGLAVAGIRETAAGPARKAGRGLALLGLALAVGFGFQAVTTAAVGSWVNQRRAIETVMRWQQTIAAGDWLAAQEFCFPVALPPVDPFGSSDEHAGHDHQHGEAGQEGSKDTPQLEAFKHLPVVEAIAEHGPATVMGCSWDDAQTRGSWRVDLALGDGEQSLLSVWLYPETKTIPHLTPEATRVAEVELWRIIQLEPGPKQ